MKYEALAIQTQTRPAGAAFNWHVQRGRFKLWSLLRIMTLWGTGRAEILLGKTGSSRMRYWG